MRLTAADNRVEIHVGDCRETLAALPEASVDCIVTSPPYYGLRDYGCEGQIGLEQTPAAYVAEIVGVMRACRRVLKPGGTLWVNIGDSYSNGGRSTRGVDDKAPGLRPRFLAWVLGWHGVRPDLAVAAAPRKIATPLQNRCGPKNEKTAK